jgi:hypothetical protein
MAQDWQDAPLTPGEWVYSRDASGGSQALFAGGSPEASFLVRCDASLGQVTLAREGVGSQLRIRTSTREQTLRATPGSERMASLSATLPASDPLLDEIVFSRGRLAVDAEGLPRLVIPAWPEPARVVEDCRAR